MIEYMLTACRMENFRTKCRRIRAGTVLQTKASDTLLHEETPNLQLVWLLSYLTNTARPEALYVSRRPSCFTHCSTKNSLHNAKCMLKYMNGARTLGATPTNIAHNISEEYNDVD